MKLSPNRLTSLYLLFPTLYIESYHFDGGFSLITALPAAYGVTNIGTWV